MLSPLSTNLGIDCVQLQIYSPSPFESPRRFPLSRTPFQRYHLGTPTTIPAVTHRRFTHDRLQGRDVY